MAQRVCIVACDVVGPIRNGGVGTAVTALAELLAEDSDNAITILYPTEHTETHPITHWIGEYRKKGIRLESLFARETGKELSYLVYQWLKAQTRFDVIHYHDWLGIGYWTACAKKQGLAFADTTLVCQVHGQTIWHLNHSGEFISKLEQVEADFLERRSVEMADVVFSPSQYMMRWMQSRDWKLPEQRFVTPNLLPKAFMEGIGEKPKGKSSEEREALSVEEIVFFGRLETRKGLELFCRAIDPLGRQPSTPLSVTFLGKIGEVRGRPATEYLAEISRDWVIPYQILEDYDVYAATRYLQGRGRLAVIASTIENSPYTVLECLALGIPCLAADVGGVRELIAPENQETVLFAREELALRKKLVGAVQDGVTRAKTAVPLAANRETWKAWHQGLGGSISSAPAIVSRTPLVSVCMSTFNRPELLRFALKSIENQTYKKIEVVLVDDASPSARAREFIEDLSPEFDRRGWKLIRNEKELWTGKSRNLAVKNSSGEFVLLMDDDNVAKDVELETLVRAASATNADIVTCQQQPFGGSGASPRFEAERPIGFLPIGPNLPQAMFENCLGDLNMLVRRSTWDELGGFTEEKCGCEDYEFLARAVIKGYRLECVPEILFFYRVTPGALANRYDDFALYQSFMRVLRPFEDVMPKELRAAMTFAVTQKRHAERMAGHGYWRRQEK